MAATPQQLRGRGDESLRKERLELKEDSNLELRLGPPGQIRRDSSHGESKKGGFPNNSLLHLDDGKKKACSNAAAAVPPRTTHKRSSPAPVVGWPPVRSFRKKNIASGCSNKQATSLPPNKFRKEETDTKKSEQIPVNNNSNSHLFVKIYMDGFPIGRKINLRAYHSYEKLSVAIDELFGGLLPQTKTEDDRGTTVVGEDNNNDEAAASGEHTLVYEDNEGDRILVGDVPWNMFVSTAKKLRVLRSSTVSIPLD